MKESIARCVHRRPRTGPVQWLLLLSLLLSAAARTSALLGAWTAFAASASSSGLGSSWNAGRNAESAASYRCVRPLVPRLNFWICHEVPALVPARPGPGRNVSVALCLRRRGTGLEPF